MTQLKTEPSDSNRILDYQNANRGTGGVGCMILSILLATGVGILLGMGVFLGVTSGSVAFTLVGLFLAAGAFGIIFWGIKEQVGNSAAGAIAIISFCVFLLMFGTCAAAGFAAMFWENAHR